MPVLYWTKHCQSLRQVLQEGTTGLFIFLHDIHSLTTIKELFSWVPFDYVWFLCWLGSQIFTDVTLCHSGQHVGGKRRKLKLSWVPWSISMWIEHTMAQLAYVGLLLKDWPAYLLVLKGHFSVGQPRRPAWWPTSAGWEHAWWFKKKIPAGMKNKKVHQLH